MKIIFTLFFFCHAAFSVRHLLEMPLIVTSGLPDFPEFVVTVTINGIQTGYFDNSMEKGKLRDDLAEAFIKDFPQDLELFNIECHTLLNMHRKKMTQIKEYFGQSDGVHILQRSGGCEWDDETKETVSFQQYGYNGKDFATLDMQKMTWTAPKHQMFTLKKWDSDSDEVEHNKFFYHYICPEWLKKYVRYGGSSLQRTVLPSVSLLQKSPSSPVTCHASGFFPNKTVLFWRRDGEELFEEVKHGDILPNHDGTFQMSVDLDVSSVKTEDWRRYECVFQLTGVKEDIITKLEETAIRSNKGSKFPFPGVIAGLLLLLSVCIAGPFIWRKKNNGFQLTNREQEAPEEEEAESVE